MKPEVQVFESVEALQVAAARQVAEALHPTTQGRIMSIALSGGSTPRRFHELLAALPGIDWSRVHVFWGDERTVPPDDEQSNYRMARETLLSRVEIPEENIHRMRGELDPAEAASDYERILGEVTGIEPPSIPRLDIVLLGMGADGHTASLFPGTAALEETERWVVANEVPQQQTTRITLTYPVLNHAHLTCFLVTGADKADALSQVFSGSSDAPPAAGVQPVDGQLVWFLDQDAAEGIRRKA
jgi:6-phosphogluconolactonase